MRQVSNSNDNQSTVGFLQTRPSSSCICSHRCVPTSLGWERRHVSRKTQCPRKIGTTGATSTVSTPAQRGHDHAWCARPSPEADGSLLVHFAYPEPCDDDDKDDDDDDDDADSAQEDDSNEDVGCLFGSLLLGPPLESLLSRVMQ